MVIVAVALVVFLGCVYLVVYCASVLFSTLTKRLKEKSPTTHQASPDAATYIRGALLLAIIARLFKSFSRVTNAASDGYHGRGAGTYDENGIDRYGFDRNGVFRGVPRRR